MGDHFMFIGEVVNILVDEDKYDGVGIKSSEYTYFRVSDQKNVFYFE